jgi:hypothetical protein
MNGLPANGSLLVASPPPEPLHRLPKSVQKHRQLARLPAEGSTAPEQPSLNPLTPLSPRTPGADEGELDFEQREEGGPIVEERESQTSGDAGRAAVLLAVSKTIMSELDLCSLLGVVELEASKLIGAEYCTALIHDEEFDELWSVEVQEETEYDEREAVEVRRPASGIGM